MPYRLLDSNILLAYVRGQALYRRIEARYALKTSSPVSVISVVTEGEMRSLALQFAWGSGRRQDMEDLLGYFPIIPLPFTGVIEAYAEIDDYSRRRGIAIGKNDVWIAATAHVTGARLLTTDRDFDHLDGAFLQRDWIDPATV